MATGGQPRGPAVRCGTGHPAAAGGPGPAGAHQRLRGRRRVRGPGAGHPPPAPDPAHRRRRGARPAVPGAARGHRGDPHRARRGPGRVRRPRRGADLRGAGRPRRGQVEPGPPGRRPGGRGVARPHALVELLGAPPVPGVPWLVLVDGFDEVVDERARTRGRPGGTSPRGVPGRGRAWSAGVPRRHRDQRTGPHHARPAGPGVRPGARGRPAARDRRADHRRQGPAVRPDPAHPARPRPRPRAPLRRGVRGARTSSTRSWPWPRWPRTSGATTSTEVVEDGRVPVGVRIDGLERGRTILPPAVVPNACTAISTAPGIGRGQAGHRGGTRRPGGPRGRRGAGREARGRRGPLTARPGRAGRPDPDRVGRDRRRFPRPRAGRAGRGGRRRPAGGTGPRVAHRRVPPPPARPPRHRGRRPGDQGPLLGRRGAGLAAGQRRGGAGRAESRQGARAAVQR